MKKSQHQIEMDNFMLYLEGFLYSGGIALVK
jgi:hypothetical protein